MMFTLIPAVQAADGTESADTRDLSTDTSTLGKSISNFIGAGGIMNAGKNISKPLNAKDADSVSKEKDANELDLDSDYEEAEAYNMFSNFGTHDSDDSGHNSAPKADGFTVEHGGDDDLYVNYGSTENGHMINLGGGGGDNDGYNIAKVYIDGNETLRTMAAGGDLQFRFNCHLCGYKQEVGYSAGSTTTKDKHDKVHMILTVTDADGDEVTLGDKKTGDSTDVNGEEHHKWYDSGWVTLEPGDVITIKVSTWGDADGNVGITETGLFFRDLVSPRMTDYELETNGAEYYNTSSQKNEVLLKQYGVEDSDHVDTNDPNYIDFTLNFSEPVMTSMGGAGITGSDDYMLLNQMANHALFTNPENTGYERQGEYVYLKLNGVTCADGEEPAAGSEEEQNALLQKYGASWHYRWQAEEGDFSGGEPIQYGGDWYGPRIGNNHYAYLTKVYMASLHDAAGNPLVDKNGDVITADTIKAIADENGENSAGEGVLTGNIRITNTATDGGTPSDPLVINTYDEVDESPMSYLDFIIDAVKPTYSITSNGIQPDILSQVVLNNNDQVTFSVNFSEGVIVKRYKADGQAAAGYMTDHTYLKFNNGMKAYYKGGYGSKQWTFSMTVDDETSAEVGTLEVVALACDEHPGDTYVLTDYVGNPLDLSAGSIENRSSIAWAGLSVDNTKPEIAFTADENWAKTAAVTVNASDPVLADGSESKGIFHISNTTEGEDNAKGLIFYIWLKADGTDTDGNGVDDGIDTAVSDLTKNCYGAIKKYSLTTTQPDGYKGSGSDVGALVMANNESTIEAPDSICTDEESGEWYLLVFTSDMTWDSARQLIQYQKLKAYKETAVGMAAYLGWINEYQDSKGADHVTDESQASNDAIYYADQQGLKEAGDYKEWTLSDYQADDSNWTYKYRVVKLDNTAPSMALVSTSGSGTSDVQVTVSASDGNSGLSAFSYQFVKTEESCSEAAWTKFSGVSSGDNTAEKTASTKALSLEDGTYDLYGKAIDAAGNETVSLLASSVKVDASKSVVHQFNIAPNDSGTAVKSITGLTVSAGAARGSQKLGVTVSYAVTDSVSVPTEWTGTLTSSGDGEPIDGVATGVYSLPDLTGVDGVKYVHIMVSDSEGVDSTFHAAYKLDNTAPKVTFNPNGVTYAQNSVSVTVSAQDDNNGKAVKYMWVKDGAAAPTADTTEGWTEFEDLTLITDSEEFADQIAEGESVSFRLYVYATDEADNAVVTASEPFLFYRSQDIAAPTGLTGALKSVYGSVSDGYRAVVQLTPPETVNPAECDYSTTVVDTDGSFAWSRWMPYESIVGVSLGDSSSLTGKQIWVKFRSSTGAVNDEDDYIKLSGDDLTVPAGGAVWATVSRDKLKKIAGGGTVNLELTVPDGVTASISQTGISGSGTSYAATENGYYAFTLTDGTNTDTLYVVVSNFDTTAPVGSITYSTKSPTCSDVTAFLSTSEDVTITNNGGSYAYTFTENGQYVFEFQDEAGNPATCTANVTWIDKTPPSARVDVGYSYTSGGKNYMFGTIKNGESVVLAQGAVLTAEGDGEKAITVVSGADTPGEAAKKILENGFYQFIVTDSVGNTAAVGQTMDYIIPSVEPPEVSISYVNAKTGEPVDTAEIGGATYAMSPDAEAVITLSGTVDGYAKGNRLYDGAIKNTGTEYSNLVSSGNTLSGPAAYTCDANGGYTIKKFYTSNGIISASLCDELGNRVNYSYTVTGLDKQAPEITFDGTALWINQSTDVATLGDDWWISKGGYAVSDNVSATEDISVSVDTSELNTDTAGSYPVTYTVTDQAGNSSRETRTAYVLPSKGLLVQGDGILFYSKSSDAAILPDNSIQLSVSRYKLMEYGTGQNSDGTWNTETVTNEAATYDVFIQEGLYREGQLKYIQTVSLRDQDTATVTIAPDQLTSPGWYTIIVRNSEREREYTTFFILTTSDS
jgi:hypothetical protein